MSSLNGLKTKKKTWWKILVIVIFLLLNISFSSASSTTMTTKTITVTHRLPIQTIQTITIILKPADPYMTVNGVKKEIDPGRGTKPVIIPKWGRTVTPMRAIVEALGGRIVVPKHAIVEAMGGTIVWNGTEKKITISLNDTVIELWIDNPKARVNGETKWIDKNNHEVRPIIINGRTMLPLRFIAESLGCTVDWNPKTRIITITRS